MLRFPQLKYTQMSIIFLRPKSSVSLDFSGFLWYNLRVILMLPEVRTVIEKGNMTDAEYIAMLENEIKKRDKKIDKLEIENECLKKDCHIYLEALILSKHRMFGKSSEHTECEGQQSFFNEAETEYAEKTEEPVKKTVKGYTRKNPKTKRDEFGSVIINWTENI